MLSAAGNPNLAEKLARCLTPTLISSSQGQGTSGPLKRDTPDDVEDNCSHRLKNAAINSRAHGSFSTPFAGSALARLRSGVRERVAQFLHRLELKYGYFLPYHLSEMRNDEFLKSSRTLAAKAEINTALLLGAAHGEGTTEAFLAGIMENPRKPSVFCINGSSTRRFLKLQKAFAGSTCAKFHGISASSQEEFSSEIQRVFKTCNQGSQKIHFDAVLIDGSEFDYELPACGELIELQSAKIVLLDDINTLNNFDNYNALLSNPTYCLSAHNPGLRNGYAIFEKVLQPKESAEHVLTYGR